MIRNRVQNLHGRGRSKIHRIYHVTNRFVGVGISTNAMARSAGAFTTCAIISDATKAIEEPLIQSDTSKGEILEFVNKTHTKEWLLRELTNDQPGVRKYKRGFEWDWTSASGFSNAIDSSLYALPLDRPPPLENDQCAAYALSQYKELFSIECPVDVAMFEFLLKDHPNKALVKSVTEGLKHGFGPMSNVPSSKTIMVPNHKVCDEFPELLEKARDTEVEAGHYSKGFYTLLPGMKVSPLFLVSKKGSEKMRVCTDMSFGSPSLNDSIDKDKIKCCFDSLISFAPYMVEMYRRGIKLVVWKSDVQNAYRLLAMALAWQMRQVVKVRNTFHIDKCANFGSAASPKIWVSFFSLVLWIARTRLGLTRINNLMDDTWGVCPASSMVTFKGHLVPLDQAKLLLLFDLLKIPWEWKKQLYGEELEIIGHLAKANELSFSLPSEKKAELVAALRIFTSTKSRSLRDWQSMLGWASWGLNLFPLGRWALQSSWDKIAGKTHKALLVPHNKTIQTDLCWLVDELERSDGHFFLASQVWHINEADFICTTDACPNGLGIWLPNSGEGFHAGLSLPSRDIFWAELAATVHRILIGLERGCKKILVCSDSSNVCDLFLSHSPKEKV